MPQAIAAATAWIATAVSAAAANAAAIITGGNIAIDAAISTTVYYGTQLVIYAGLSLALAPNVPKPEAGNATFRQAVPTRRRGYGEYRTGGPFGAWEARKDQAFDIVMLHAGEIDSVVGYYLHDDRVTLVGNTVQSPADGRYWSEDHRVRLITRLGLATETAIPEFVAAMPGYWTTAHRGDGIAQLAMIATNGKLVHFQHDFPNGEPNPSAVIRAQRVFDPRDMAQDEADPSTWVWSENAALCYLHYLMYDRGYAYDWTAAEVATFNPAKWTRRFARTLQTWVAAANVCDEDVELAGGGTEKRYTIGGQYFLDQDETAVVNQFLTSMDGWSSTDGRGGFILSAGRFTPPTVTLTDRHIRALNLKLGLPAESQVNTINISFCDPAKGYNTSDADPWVDDAAIAVDGRPRPEQLDLPWVKSFTQARRLAKRRMERHQASCRGSASVTMAALNVNGQSILGQRFIEFDLSLAYGPLFQNLIVEITGNMSIDLASMTLSFDWTAVDPASRDGWVPATDEGTPPPPVDPSPSEPLPIPTIDTISASYGIDPNPRVTMNVTGPDRADIDWESQWRVQGATLFQPIEHPDDGDIHPSPVLQSGFVPADALLQFQVRYHTGGGVYSEWSPIATVDTSAAWPTFDSTTTTFDSEVVTWDAEP